MNQKFYLGTYTKRSSKGLYSIELDVEKKQLKNLKLEATVQNPTYIDVDENNIYSVCSKNNKGGVCVIKNQKIIAEHISEDATPCYIHKNKDILSANYHTGTVIKFSLEKDKLEIKNKEINSKNVNAHFAEYIENNNYILTCYLGIDEVSIYDKEFKKISVYKTKENSGPRHIVFHKTLNVAYLICELDATIEVLKFNKENLTFELMQKLEITENIDDKKWAAAIKITSCSKYLYASNRGKDVISSYKILEDGTLEKIQTIDTFGKVARDFCLDKTEKFLIVGHQESDNLSLFERNSDGTLKLISCDTHAPEVVCIKNF